MAAAEIASSADLVGFASSYSGLFHAQPTDQEPHIVPIIHFPLRITQDIHQYWDVEQRGVVLEKKKG